MKKLIALSAAFLAAASALAAASGPVNELNAEIQALLRPFQNESTTASLQFSRIETDSTRALAASVALLYRKVGSTNTLEVSVPELSYEYGNGTSPTTTANGLVRLDLTKILPQETLNQIIPDLEETIEGLAKGAAAEYGEAVWIDAKLTEKNQDGKGNWVSAKGTIAFSIDLKKLPQNVKREDVIVSQGTVEIGMDVSTGLTFALRLVSNPKYKGFQKNNQGLKELLDAFLNRDERTLKDLSLLFQSLDGFASSFVNAQKR